MVPYVRKSFYKHFCDGMKYIEEGFCEYNGDSKNLSIDDNFYKDFNQCEKAYQYAMDMTEKEVH